MNHPPNDPSVAGERPGLTPDLRRQLFRLSGQHFLGAARLIAGAVDRDLVTALIFLCIGRANLRDLTSDPRRAMPYAAVSTIPPDSERVPVSVYAVAKEMGIPYETVRRHAGKLRAADLLEAVTGGLIIPNRAFLTPSLLAAVVEYWKETVDFVNAAAEGGIVALVPAQTPAGDVARQVMRLGVNQFLEMLDAMARAVGGEPITAVVLSAIGFANVRNVTLDPDLAAVYAGLSTPPPSDAERRPVSVNAISKSLMLPYETTRRHVQTLLDQGLLRKVAGGLIVPAEAVDRPRIAQGMADCAEVTLTYLAQLARYGVIPQVAGAATAR